jgi:hypothetical protein
MEAVVAVVVGPPGRLDAMEVVVEEALGVDHVEVVVEVVVDEVEKTMFLGTLWQIEWPLFGAWWRHESDYMPQTRQQSARGRACTPSAPSVCARSRWHPQRHFLELVAHDQISQSCCLKYWVTST